MRRVEIGFLVLGGLALGGSALAQIPVVISEPSAESVISEPSAKSIIDQLRPRPTRGIRPLAPAALPAAAPASAPAVAGMTPVRPPAASPPPPAAVQAEAPPSVDLTVQFTNNSAELTPAAIRTLDQLGRALSSQALASYRFRIEGHTDTLGSADRNRLLSNQRAQAVVEYLANRFAVDRMRLDPVGMGQTQPLVPTGANVSEPRNRRVKVVNVGA